MKYNKWLLLALLVFSPALVYSQYLDLQDIDLFLEYYEDITETLDVNDESDKVQNRYTASLMAFLSALGELGRLEEQISDADFEHLKTLLQNFMDCQVPGKFSDALKAAGWKRNGHQKFWTIFLGAGFSIVRDETDMDEEEEAILEKILTLFHPWDLELIDMRRDDIRQVVE